MDKQKYILVLIFLIFLLLVVNYYFIDKRLGGLFNERQYAEVDRVIDGDTIVVNNKSTRLLGINCPEEGEMYYEEAGNFLEELISNKTIGLEIGKKDKYNRDLAFVFISNTNINAELVRTGLANVYILDDRKYESQLREAWEECLEQNVNLCERSENRCAECIELKKFDYKNEEVIFHNKCNFDCELTDWEIKDKGRKKFIFDDFELGTGKDVSIIVGDGQNTETTLFWTDEYYVWTDTGDTLFLRDDEGKLILWKGY